MEAAGLLLDITLQPLMHFAVRRYIYLFISKLMRNLLAKSLRRGWFVELPRGEIAFLHTEQKRNVKHPFFSGRDKQVRILNSMCKSALGRTHLFSPHSFSSFFLLLRSSSTIFSSSPGQVQPRPSLPAKATATGPIVPEPVIILYSLSGNLQEANACSHDNPQTSLPHCSLFIYLY